jgi:hypothetical protein
MGTTYFPEQVLVAGAKPQVYTLQSDVYGLCIVLAEVRVVRCACAASDESNRTGVMTQIFQGAQTMFTLLLLRSDLYFVLVPHLNSSMVLQQIILAELPFGDQPNLVSQQRWLEMLTLDNLRPTLPDALPGPLRKIIEQGWSSDPTERPTAAEILTVIDEYVILNRPTAGSEDEV